MLGKDRSAFSIVRLPSWRNKSGPTEALPSMPSPTSLSRSEGWFDLSLQQFLPISLQLLSGFPSLAGLLKLLACPFQTVFVLLTK